MNDVIKPTVGRKVWYRPSEFDRSGPGAMQVAGSVNDPAPLDATIIAVWGDRMVSALVTDVAGRQFPVLSVTLVQGDDPKPSGGRYVEWPTKVMA